MKYITVEKESEAMKWSIVYCNCNGNEAKKILATRLNVPLYCIDVYR